MILTLLFKLIAVNEVEGEEIERVCQATLDINGVGILDAEDPI